MSVLDLAVTILSALILAKLAFNLTMNIDGVAAASTAVQQNSILSGYYDDFWQINDELIIQQQQMEKQRQDKLLQQQYDATIANVDDIIDLILANIIKESNDTGDDRYDEGSSSSTAARHPTPSETTSIITKKEDPSIVSLTDGVSVDLLSDLIQHVTTFDFDGSFLSISGDGTAGIYSYETYWEDQGSSDSGSSSEEEYEYGQEYEYDAEEIIELYYRYRDQYYAYEHKDQATGAGLDELVENIYYRW